LTSYFTNAIRFVALNFTAPFSPVAMSLFLAASKKLLASFLLHATDIDRSLKSSNHRKAAE